MNENSIAVVVVERISKSSTLRSSKSSSSPFPIGGVGSLLLPSSSSHQQWGAATCAFQILVGKRKSVSRATVEKSENVVAPID